MQSVWFPLGAGYHNCHLQFYLLVSVIYTRNNCRDVIGKDIVQENWGPLLVLCHLLSGISCSLSVWSGLKSISSSAVMNILRASMWKILLFPPRTLFPSNLWLFASVSPQSWSWHLSSNMCQLLLDGALFQGGFVVVVCGGVFSFFFFVREHPCGTRPIVKPPYYDTLHPEKGRKYYILRAMDFCFLCQSQWHIKL